MKLTDKKKTNTLLQRWTKLLRLLQDVKHYIDTPQIHHNKKVVVTSVGRILNMLVGTFVYSDDVLLCVQRDMNTMLVRMQTNNDAQQCLDKQRQIIQTLIAETKSEMTKLEKSKEE